MGSTISDRPSCRCFRKRSCCTILTIWIRRWRRCAPTSSARLCSTDRGPAITLRWDVRCSIPGNSCKARTSPPRKPVRKTPAHSQRPPQRRRPRLPKRPCLTCSANRKHRAIESAPGKANRPIAFAHFAWFDYSSGLNQLLISEEDHAFSCDVGTVHLPVVFPRSVLQQASRYGLQLCQPEHGWVVERWRWKCDEFSSRASSRCTAAPGRARGPNPTRKAGRIGGVENHPAGSVFQRHSSFASHGGREYRDSSGRACERYGGRRKTFGQVQRRGFAGAAAEFNYGKWERAED